MSYVLVDVGGTAVDLATNAGLERLREGAGPLFLRLLDEGGADGELLTGIISESTAPEYVLRLLRELKPPVIISNGIEEEIA